MQYEFVSRALAYVSCFSTLSLFMTSMAIAAINVGKAQPLSSCPAHVCVAGILVTDSTQFAGLADPTAVERLAVTFWSAKT